jgi:hypothetical protein
VQSTRTINGSNGNSGHVAAVGDVFFDVFFRGPPTSASGGYAAGVTARLLDEPARVSLPKPPPVGRRLSVRRVESGVKVFDRDEVVLVAKQRGQLDVQVPHIDLAAARSATGIPEILANHRAPTCVVCGPGRSDGFRIFPGSLGPGLVATPWQVPSIGCQEDGELASPILWAALDCPGGWCFNGAHVEFVPVLVSQSVESLKPVRAGEEVIIVGWATGRADRTLRACTAILDLAGEPLAVSKQTCVAVSAGWAK